MVLAYMDSRSVMGPAKDLFTWTPERFGRLLAYHNVSSDGGGGEPVDTLFDAFLLSGDTWYGGKNLWPYVSPDPLNATDWLGILDMHLTMGAAQLDVAAANISARLPFATADSCAQLRPAVILTIPFPDVRAENFGAINGSGRSLNFSHVDDRILACEWYIRLAHRRWAERGYTHVRLTGFYWYLEELLVGKSDELLIPAVSRDISHSSNPSGVQDTRAPQAPGPSKHILRDGAVHACRCAAEPCYGSLLWTGAIKSVDPSLMFVWIPYFKGRATPHLDEWSQLGFDVTMMQVLSKGE